MKLKVWKWYHNWGDDTNTRLFPSEVAAKQAIHHYVQEQWDVEDMDYGPPTGDVDTDILKYFGYHEDEEWYSLDAQTVEFPDLPGAADEVILSSEECAAIVHALDNTAYGNIAEALGVETDAAIKIVDSAYRKLKD